MNAIPFIVMAVQILTGMLAVGLSLLAWQRRRLAGQPAIYFSLAALCEAVYAWAYIGELSSRTVEAALTWIKIEYIGIPFIAPLWLLFVLNFTGHGTWITRGRIWALLVVPAITLGMVFTAEWHHLFHVNAWMEVRGPFVIFTHIPGPFYWLTQIYDNLALVVTTALIVQRMARALPAFRRQVQIFLLGTLLQWTSLVVFMSGYSPYGLDLSSLTLSLSSSIFLVGLVRFRALSLMPVARDVIFERMLDGVLVLDADDRLIDFNPAAQKMLPELRPDTAGDPVSEILRARPELAAQIAAGCPAILEMDDPPHYFESQLTAITDGRGRATGKMVTLHDITQARELLEQMRSLATHDSLTGLYNRRYFLELAQREVEQTHRYPGAISILTIDLDHFKQINDTWGHAGGDAVLQAAAALMGSLVRKVDIVGRLGGEEFWILLPNTAVPEALTAAERLRQGLEQALIGFEDHVIRITASLGVSGCQPTCKALLGDLMHAADEALYEAKADGRNCVRWRELKG